MSGHQGSTLAFDKRSIKVNRPYPAASPMLAPMRNTIHSVTLAKKSNANEI
ncbi:hypothetical protein D083_2576 [Dickeya solani RNS 08.23.3.1.A]|nr:hypothetical protein D083_2576 [Dickeya solani RNS 08.23.3.1.A]